MKKYVGYFLITYFVLQFNNLSFSQGERWVFVTESDNVSYYLDTLSIIRDKYGNMEVWFMEYCLSNCRNTSNRNKTLDYTLTKYKYYFSERKCELLYRVNNFTDGTNSDLTPKSKEKWEIVPDSIGEELFNYVFQNYSPSTIKYYDP